MNHRSGNVRISHLMTGIAVLLVILSFGPVIYKTITYPQSEENFQQRDCRVNIQDLFEAGWKWVADKPIRQETTIAVSDLVAGGYMRLRSEPKCLAHGRYTVIARPGSEEMIQVRCSSHSAP